MNELQGLIEFLSRLGPFGLLCVVVWLIFSGRLVLKREWDREHEARVKAEESLDKARPVLEKAIDAMNRVPDVAKRAVETVGEVVKRQDGAGR